MEIFKSIKKVKKTRQLKRKSQRLARKLRQQSTLRFEALEERIALSVNFYVAPGDGGDGGSNPGDDSNPGTFASPFKTIVKAFNSMSAGDTAFFRGGTYDFDDKVLLEDKSGTSGNLLSFLPYLDEQPVFDFATAAGNVSADDDFLGFKNVDYLRFEGFEITKTGTSPNEITRQGLSFRGVNFSIIAQLDVHNFAGNGFSLIETSHDNLIENNDSHNNAVNDGGSGGSNADGFWLGRFSHDNTIRGNRSFENNDDGFDFWEVGVNNILENNWAFDNGHASGAINQGDGNGFKLGKGNGGGPNTIRNNLSWGNRLYGFIDNSNQGVLTLHNNTSYDNGDGSGDGNGGYFFEATTAGETDILRNNISVSDDSRPGHFSGADDPFNSWEEDENDIPIYTANTSDFVTTNDSANRGARQSDGSLPVSDFLHLVSGSDLIDVGEDVGLPFNGSAPDFGAVEFSTTTTAPGQATNPSPGNGATNVSIAADLSWSAGSGATSHNVYFGMATSPPLVVTGQTATSYDPGTLNNDATYYWKIDEVNSAGTTLATQVWSFTTESASGTGGLVGHWKLDETSGTTASDSSGNNNNNGTYEDGPTLGATPATNFSGTSVSFDGNNDNVFIPDDSSLRVTDMTVSAWVKIPGSIPGGWRTIVEHGRGTDNWFGLWKRSGSDRFHFRWANNGGSTISADTNATIDADKWYHVVGTLDSMANEAKIYLTDSEGNTVVDTTISNPTFPSATSGDLTLGENNDGNEAFEGSIDDVRIYNRALNATEVAALVPSASLPGQASSPDPGNNATDIDINDDLVWNAGSGATEHDVYFSTDSTVDSNDLVGRQSGTSYDPGTLNNGATYYWRINEVNSAGVTLGQVWSYTTAIAAPGQASSPTPGNSATDIDVDDNLSWSAGSGATEHDVYFSTDSTIDSSDLEGRQSGTSYDPGTLNNGATYYWRIDEVNSGGVTQGLVWSFTTESASGTGGLVGHWKLDETSGTVVNDSSGNNNNGTYVDGPTLGVSGVDGTAVSFDGSNDNVSIPNHSSLQVTNMTVAAWVYIPSSIPTGWKTIVEHARGTDNWFGLWKSNNANTFHFRWGANGGGTVSTDFATSISPNTWYHVVGVLDADNDIARVYLDGKLDKPELTGVDTPTAASGDLTIGENNSSSEAFGGRIDDVRIYDTPLNATEIAALAAVAPTGLVGHWKLDETSGTTVNDSSGNNNGTYDDGPTLGATPATNFSGTSVSFDGNNDNVTIPDDSSLRVTDMTVSAWVYIPSSVPSGWRTIVEHGRGTDNWFGLWKRSGSDRFHFRWANNGGSTISADFDSTISADTWYHVVGTLGPDGSGGTEARVYLNGISDKDPVSNPDLPTATSGITTIGENNDGNEAFEGSIDDVRIYNRALTATEVADLTPPSSLLAGPAFSADFDGDDDVDGSDFLAWQRGVGVGSSTSGAVADLSDWESQYGGGLESSSGVAASYVSEPPLAAVAFATTAVSDSSETVALPPLGNLGRFATSELEVREAAVSEFYYRALHGIRQYVAEPELSESTRRSSPTTTSAQSSSHQVSELPDSDALAIVFGLLGGNSMDDFLR